MTRIEPYNTMFAGHTLSPIVDVGSVTCWCLSNSGNLNRSRDVQITSSPMGMTIMTRMGQFRAWSSDIPLTDFVGELTSEYLASKFLTLQWTREAAERHFWYLVGKLEAACVDGEDDACDIVEDMRNKHTRDLSIFESEGGWQKGLAQELDAMLCGIGRFADPMIEAHESIPPLGYDADEVAQLVAIHNRFRETFVALYRVVGDELIRREIG